MWIPHRVFFANLAFALAVLAGVVLLAWRPLDRRRVAEATLGPPVLAGAFVGLTATRGMPLLWWERVGIALWTAALMAAWLLLGATAAVSLLRPAGASRPVQALGAAAAAALLFVLTRAVLR